MGSEKLNEIGSNAGELLRAFLSHDAAHIAFSNTIFAVHGVNSPAGRIIDRNSMSYTLMILGYDFRWFGDDRGMWTYDDPRDESGRRIPPVLSAAAPRMIENRSLPLAREFYGCLEPSAD
jgi:hypothetical protein